MLALLALAVLSPSPHDVGAPTATPDAVRPRVACLPDAELPLLSHVQLLLRKHAAAAYDCCANSLANESGLDVFGTIDSLSDLDVIPTCVTAYDDVYTEEHWLLALQSAYIKPLQRTHWQAYVLIVSLPVLLRLLPVQMATFQIPDLLFAPPGVPWLRTPSASHPSGALWHLDPTMHSMRLQEPPFL